MKSWAGPGNEASTTDLGWQSLKILVLLLHEECLLSEDQLHDGIELYKVGILQAPACIIQTEAS